MRKGVLSFVILIQFFFFYDIVTGFVFTHVCSDNSNNKKDIERTRRIHKRPITKQATSNLKSLELNSVMEPITDSTEYARQELARKQKEYESALREKTRAQAQKSTEPIPSLNDLTLFSYLTEDGIIQQVPMDRKIRASVYAIYDDKKILQYVGISRNVNQSLRLHLARCPELTYYYRVHHITKPSKAVLELTKEAWILEGGPHVPGNKDDTLQERWEKPLDVMPTLTEEDKELIATTRDRGRPEESAIKKIARRHEAKKVEILEGRGCTENLRFDPKLKGKGLLDLYIERPKDDVPTTDLEKQKAAGANA